MEKANWEWLFTATGVEGIGWVKQAVEGMETKWDGFSHGMVRLWSNLPQDVDAESLRQLMRWLDEFMEEKSIKGY